MWCDTAIAVEDAISEFSKNYLALISDASNSDLGSRYSQSCLAELPPYRQIYAASAPIERAGFVIRLRPAAATFWKGCFRGYRWQLEIRDPLNYRAILRDFGSFPGSQINQ